jgi:hypothetical protein
MERRNTETQDLRYRSICIKTSPLPVSHNDQKQIEDHRFMAQPMKISALKDLVVDDGVTLCPAHAPSVD